VVGDVAERVDRDGAERSAIVVVARETWGYWRSRRGGEAEPLERRPEHRPHEGLEAPLGGLGRQILVDECEPAGDVAKHDAHWLAAIAGGERQIVRGGVPVRADERPLVADERGPLGRAQGI